MNKLALLVLVPTFLVGGAVMSTSVLTVDVDAADAPHFVVPVPLPVARAALTLAPDEAKWVEAPDVARHLPELERVAAALGQAPDGMFVDVDDGGQRVRIAKDGDALRVRVVDGPSTTVDLHLPVRLAEAVLRAYDRERGSFRSSDLLAALGTVPDGKFVHVLDDGDEVQLRVW